MIPPLRATASDAARLSAIHAACFPPNERWNENVMVLQLGLLGGFGLLHPAGGFVLARVAADEAEILTIAVRPAAQRAGLGRQLLRAVMEEAHTRGAKKMFLEVAPENAAARALYAGFGFLQVGRRPHYYPTGGDALVLSAPLGRPLWG
jgi:[ribosomal protein S18]-alanine N-acetyltransferase